MDNGNVQESHKSMSTMIFDEYDPNLDPHLKSLMESVASRFN